MAREMVRIKIRHFIDNPSENQEEIKQQNNVLRSASVDKLYSSFTSGILKIK